MKKTLLILGAGSTKDVFNHFPIGVELIQEINYHLITDKIYPPDSKKGPFLSALMNELLRVFVKKEFIGKAIDTSCFSDPLVLQWLKNVNALKTILWDSVLDYEYYLPRGEEKEVPSIDSLIHKNIANKKLDPQVHDIARYVILYLLIGMEEAFKYRLKKDNKAIDDNWINQLCFFLKKYDFDEIKAKMKIISFNYERVFKFLCDQYLNLGFNQDDKNRFLDENIKHIYGSFEEIQFGEKNDNTAVLKDVYRKFKLMYNNERPNSLFDDESFEQIGFIGFGYDKFNLENLHLSNYRAAIKIGTSLNFKTRKINELKDKSIEVVENRTCCELISILFK